MVGVGCTKFGELWEKDQEDLLVEAVYEALDDAGLTPQDIDAGWVGLMYNFTGFSGATMTEPLKLFGKPVTRVENFCASGMDAFRNACFARSRRRLRCRAWPAESRSCWTRAAVASP